MRDQPVVRHAAVSLTILLLLVQAALADERTKVQYLADELIDQIVGAWQDAGELGLNTAARLGDQPGPSLRITDRAFHKGLGHHANGEVLIDLAGRYSNFQTALGIQWQGGRSNASVVFQVFVDGEKRFDSGTMRETDPPRAVDVSVTGAEQLRLVVLGTDDGSANDLANWVEARLVTERAAPPIPARASVDVAAFARVVTSDPDRMKGTAAARSDEFPAADVFLDRDVSPNDGGTNLVPTYGDRGCIGLRWMERRFPRRLTLTFADPAAAVAGAQVQFWTSDGPVHYMSNGWSAWQGIWEDLQVTPVREGNRLIWTLGYNQVAKGAEKIRWIFPRGSGPITVAGISAHVKATWKDARVRLEAKRPIADQPVPIEIYNGLFIDGENGDGHRTTVWDTSRAMTVDVRYSVPAPLKSDRTVLRFALPKRGFSVAIEDVLSHDRVCAPAVGVSLSRVRPLDEPRKNDASRGNRKTVLEDVRARPDQTFDAAFAKVHNPVQNHGPMLLSLACDNRKFTVDREGTINFRVTDQPDAHYEPIFLQATVDKWFRRLAGPVRFNADEMDCPQLRPSFGRGDSQNVARALEGGWLPIPVTTIQKNGLHYQQRTYVAPVDRDPPSGAPRWLRRRAVCVAEYTVENRGDAEAAAILGITLFDNAKSHKKADLQAVARGALAVNQGRLLAWFDTTQRAALATTVEDGAVTASGTLPPGKKARVVVYLPAWAASPEEAAALRDGGPWDERTKDYWVDLFSSAMHVDLPDRALSDVLRAFQVHCMLVARNEAGGQRIVPWISADRYGPWDSEAHAVVRGMDMLGQTDFARRSLDYFVSRYNKAGYLNTTESTCVGTGQHLWTLAEHYGRTRDQAWLRGIAPKVAGVARWIIAQRQKTKQRDVADRVAPESGLMPPGVSADWIRYAYRFFNDAHYCAGLREAGRILKDVDSPNAAPICRDAQEYAEDIRRAYDWARARSPLVRLGNDTWVPGYPAMLCALGRVEDFYPAEDSSRSWCYNVELGSHHLAATEILDPRSDEVGWMLDHMEDIEFLRSGMGDYSEEDNRRDAFNRGGFAKMQPYYARHAEVYALRDDVKPFIRSYFNGMASLMNGEVLYFWEHFNNFLGWNNTAQMGWFLCQSRVMLLEERGDELWLAPFVTTNWLKQGMQVVVQRAPTRFGPVSYTITSEVDDGYIDAQIEPPRSAVPSVIVVRLRHPEEKPIRSVTVNGVGHSDFDPHASCVRIKADVKPIAVRAIYETE